MSDIPKPSEGDVEYITSHYEHIGAVQVKMVYVAEDGWWVSEEWLKKQNAESGHEQFPLFE